MTEIKCVDCSMPVCSECFNCHTIWCDSGKLCSMRKRKYIKGYQVLMVDKKIVDVDIGDIELVKGDDADG